MTRDEHRDIIAFIADAVRQDDATDQAPLDVEADAIIRALFVRNPEAAYRVTKLAMAQRDGLAQLQIELAEVKAITEESWLSRWLKKQSRRQRRTRREPNPALFTQNLRSR